MELYQKENREQMMIFVLLWSMFFLFVCVMTLYDLFFWIIQYRSLGSVNNNIDVRLKMARQQINKKIELIKGFEKRDLKIEQLQRFGMVMHNLNQANGMIKRISNGTSNQDKKKELEQIQG